jgi:hypothetical protein
MHRIVALVITLAAATAPAGVAAQPGAGGPCGLLTDTVLTYIDFAVQRPLQRVVFEDLTGGTNTTPPPGTVIRFHTDAIGGPLSFSLPGMPAAVYAFVEHERPGGGLACGGGGNQQGCPEVSGVWVYEPVTTYAYELPDAVNNGANSTDAFHLTSDGGAGPEEALTLGAYTNTYELRFTGPSWSLNPFTGFPGFQWGFQIPFSAWDIGFVAPGEPNDPADDIQLVVGLYSDFATVDSDMCANDATTFPYRFQREPSAGFQTDRIYAYFPAFTYTEFAAAVEKVLVDIEPGPLPEGYALLGARPNPAAAGAVAQYVMGEAGHARLEVFDVLGRRVALLADEMRPAGVSSAMLGADSLPPGAYLLRLMAGGGVASRPMAVAR